ncbi:hypothetical protein GCM10009753_12390 [Streptantibioticus ferralitis]
MDRLALLFILLLGTLGMVPVGERLGLPSPVLMTLLGGVLAVLPFVPNVAIRPGLILPLAPPPLIYAAPGVPTTSGRGSARTWSAPSGARRSSSGSRAGGTSAGCTTR